MADQNNAPPPAQPSTASADDANQQPAQNPSAPPGTPAPPNSPGAPTQMRFFQSGQGWADYDPNVPLSQQPMASSWFAGQPAEQPMNYRATFMETATYPLTGQQRGFFFSTSTPQPPREIRVPSALEITPTNSPLFTPQLRIPTQSPIFFPTPEVFLPCPGIPSAIGPVATTPAPHFFFQPQPQMSATAPIPHSAPPLGGHFQPQPFFSPFLSQPDTMSTTLRASPDPTIRSPVNTPVEEKPFVLADPPLGRKKGPSTEQNGNNATMMILPSYNPFVSSPPNVFDPCELPMVWPSSEYDYGRAGTNSQNATSPVKRSNGEDERIHSPDVFLCPCCNCVVQGVRIDAGTEERDVIAQAQPYRCYATSPALSPSSADRYATSGTDLEDQYSIIHLNKGHLRPPATKHLAEHNSLDRTVYFASTDLNATHPIEAIEATGKTPNSMPGGRDESEDSLLTAFVRRATRNLSDELRRVRG